MTLGEHISYVAIEDNESFLISHCYDPKLIIQKFFWVDIHSYICKQV